MRNQTKDRIVSFAVLMVVSVVLIHVLIVGCTGASAQGFVPKPYDFEAVQAKIDEHDQQICDLDERVTEIEKRLDDDQDEPEIITPATPEPVKAKIEPPVERDYDGAIIVPGSRRIAERTVSVATVPAVQAVPAVSRTVSQRKNANQLRADIAAAKRQPGYRTWATASRGFARTHLIQGAPEHRYRYTSAQLAGMSERELQDLHNLVHGPLAINPFTSARAMQVVSKVETFNPTPNPNRPTPSPPRTNYTGGCPNGRCPLVGGSRAKSRSNFWRPGKLLFGR